jgi:hypothetical protein
VTGGESRTRLARMGSEIDGGVESRHASMGKPPAYALRRRSGKANRSSGKQSSRSSARPVIAIPPPALPTGWSVLESRSVFGRVGENHRCQEGHETGQ